MYITEENIDSQLNVDFPTFISNANKHKVALGLTSADLTAITNALTAFSTGLSASNAAKAAAKAAVTSKNDAKATAKAEISKWAKIWRANQAISDSILDDMMLPPHSTPGTRTAPTTPNNFSFSVTSQGTINMKWGRNGNTSGTIFNVESSSNGKTGWSVAGSTTKTKFSINGNPGTTVYFRVVAIRNSQSATPTNPIVVWPSSGESFADLKVA